MPPLHSPPNCSAPMVHWGFHKAWTTKGFGEELCAFVQQLVWDEEAAGAGQQPPKRVLITGWVQSKLPSVQPAHESTRGAVCQRRIFGSRA